MAGIAKPNEEGLGGEITNYIINDYRLINNTTPQQLFDGVIGTTQWGKNPSWAYFYSADLEYIDITVPYGFNLWVHHTLDYPDVISKLKIQKYVNSNWIDFGYEKNSSDMSWTKTCENLQAGRYKFISTGPRVDSEWYIENTNKAKYLLKQNDQFYTFNGTNIVKSPYQALDEDNFKTNGFYDPALISQTVWDNTFPDKTELKLLMWTDDTTKTNTSMVYNTDNYKIIDKLADDFIIKMYEKS